MWCTACARRKTLRETPAVLSVGKLVTEQNVRFVWAADEEPRFEFIDRDYIALWSKFTTHVVKLAKLRGFWASLGHYLNDIKQKGKEEQSASSTTFGEKVVADHLLNNASISITTSANSVEVGTTRHPPNKRAVKGKQSKTVYRLNNSA